MADASTPLMRQYHGIKQQVPNALLMFRLGDFYELFFEDAVTAARELEITLTSRNKEKGAIPMCGVPYHAAEGYIARLIQKGYRVAICDQMEDPRLAKKLVKREVTRIVTPGTAMDANLVRSRENNYLAAVANADGRSAVAHVDLSTGEFRVTEMEPAEVSGALEHLGAREVLFPGDLPLLAGADRAGPRFVRTEIEEWVFSADYAGRTLRDHFRLLSLDGCGLANRPAAVGAAGAVLHYLRDTQRAALDHLDRPTFYDRADSMVLDAVTVRNLELLEPIFAADASGPQTQATVLGVLDHTQTGMGGRLLRQRLLRPSMDRAEIEQRLDAVGELLQQTILRAELRKQLATILDLERLLAKVTLGSAGPRDVLALGRSLEKIPALQALLRHPTSGTPAVDPRASGRAAGRCEPDPRGDCRRAAAEPRGRRDDPRRLPRGARRAARSQHQRQAVHRADRGARAAAHGHPVAQGAVQQRLRLLHRDHPREPAPGAAGLRAQADAGQRRALHHPRAEGVRAQGARRGRQDPHARKGTLRRRAEAGGRAGAAHSRHGRRRWRNWMSPRRSRRWRPRTAISGRRFPTRARCGSWRDGIR